MWKNIELHLTTRSRAAGLAARDLLRGEGIAIGRERVTTMMCKTGLEVIYRRPRTSKRAGGHKVFPLPVKLNLSGAAYLGVKKKKKKKRLSLTKAPAGMFMGLVLVWPLSPPCRFILPPCV